jgi:hypothetical protein
MYHNVGHHIMFTHSRPCDIMHPCPALIAYGYMT